MWPLIILSFTDADLKANREGRLTDAQRKVLDARAAEKRHMYRTVMPLVWLIFALLMFSTLGLFSKVATDAAKISIVLAWSLLCALLTGWVWWSFRTYARGVVRSTLTVCQMFYRPYGKDEEKATYALKIKKGLIGSHTVYVQDVDSLTHGQRYRVYYLADNPPMLLSWELDS